MCVLHSREGGMGYDDVDDDGYLFNVVTPLDCTIHGYQFPSKNQGSSVMLFVQNDKFCVRNKERIGRISSSRTL